MRSRQERSRYFGKVDTGDWDDIDVATKAVMNPASLTLTEKLKWRSMCEKLGLDPNY